MRRHRFQGPIAMAEVILKNIKKIYPHQEPKKKKKGEPEKKTNLQITEEGVLAVDNFNLHIQDKEFIVLVGPSGCGKSTTLRMVAGLEEISGGELYIGGQLMNDVAPKDRDISMVFQNYALYPHMTVRENIAFPLKLRKMDKAAIDQRVEQAAEILDITEYLDRKPKALSGGQRQRVAIGRAIVREPKVLLMDEPLSNLDAKLRTQMRSEMIQLYNRLGCTFIYVTHDQTEAMTMGTDIVIIYKGKIQQHGTPHEVYDDPANLFVAQFIGDPGMNALKLSDGGFVGFKPRAVIFGKGENGLNLTGTVLCILSAIPLFVAMMVNSGIVMNAAICVLLVLVACGVFAFVLGGTYYGATEKLLEEGDYTRHSKATRELRTAISVVYWLVVTAAFLLYTFGPKGNGQPQYSWFIWAIGGILYAALVLVVKMALRKQNNK